MTQLTPGAMAHILQTLPPERPAPFPHLANLNPDQLLQRRVEVSAQLKTLEQERQAIDAKLLEVLSDAELRFGVRASGGWGLQQRSKMSWDYAPEASKAIKDLQMQAQRDGRAQPLVRAFLMAVQDDAERVRPTRTEQDVTTRKGSYVRWPLRVPRCCSVLRSSAPVGQRLE